MIQNSEYGTGREIIRSIKTQATSSGSKILNGFHVFKLLVRDGEIVGFVPHLLFAGVNASVEELLKSSEILWKYNPSKLSPKEFQSRFPKTFKKLKSDEYYKSYWSLTEVAYGATEKLTIVANLWYFDSKIKSGSDSGKDKGVGDLYIFSKYKLISVEKEPNSGIVGLIGLRLPTGDKKNMPILRLGDGSTDIGVGFAATKQWGRTTNSIFGGLWLNTKNKGAVDKRHEVEYRATSEYKLIPQKLNIQMELKGVWFEGNKERLLELVPGIQYTPVFPVTIQVSCKVPIEAKGYFKYDYQIVFGVSFAFPVYKKTVPYEPVKGEQP